MADKLADNRIKATVADNAVPFYNKKDGRIKLQSLYDGRLSYVGNSSGELYQWNKAGEIVAVQKDDSVSLLTKKIGGGGCCGPHSDGSIFVVVN